MNTITKEEAVEALRRKNEMVKRLFEQIEMRVEEYEIPKIMAHIQRLAEIQMKLEGRLIESELHGIHIELPPL